jgi:hypothetical protein
MQQDNRVRKACQHLVHYNVCRLLPSCLLRDVAPHVSWRRCGVASYPLLGE